MPLKPAGVAEAQQLAAALSPAPAAKSYGESKDSRILYQGLTQAAVNSMSLGQFATDVNAHIANVKTVVDELAAFVLERSK